MAQRWWGGSNRKADPVRHDESISQSRATHTHSASRTSNTFPNQTTIRTHARDQRAAVRRSERHLKWPCILLGKTQTICPDGRSIDPYVRYPNQNISITASGFYAAYKYLTMLTKLELRNYRGFSNHSVQFREMNVAVGSNNAGKSTIVEALRIISLVTSRISYLTFLPVPEWLDVPAGYRGVTPSLRGIDFEFRNICHGYGTPPARISATFQNKSRISVYVDPQEEGIFAVLSDGRGRPISSRSQARSISMNSVQILPPVGPLTLRERNLDNDYVQSSLNTRLAPIHFRNQLALLREEYFERFCRLAEETWPGLQISNLERSGIGSDSEVTLFVRDGSFVAEVGWMGHGLQTWLQTIWFLARTTPESTIILDEPDIYLHADLQRKLIRLLKGNYRQIIVATHSIEMMSEVSPDEILVVDKDRATSRFSSSLSSVQVVVDKIGGVHNLQLARFWSARRCLFLEGKDLDILKVLHDKLFKDAPEPLSSIPNMSIGGSGNWKLAIGAAMGLKNAAGQKILSYCILDRDYKVEDEIEEIKKSSKKDDLMLHFWSKKEIENYLIVPTAIHRVIHRRRSGSSNAPQIGTIENQIDRISEELRDKITDSIANSVFLRNRGSGLTKANQIARGIVQTAWKSREGRSIVLPGKEVFSRLSKWSQSRYGVSFSPISVVREMSVEEIHAELKHVIESIHHSRKL